MGIVSLKQKQKVHTEEEPGLTRSLAAFISQLSSDAVPYSLEEVLRKSLIDSIGCGLFGLTTVWAQIVQSFALEQGGPDECSVWCSGGAKASAINSVIAAGTAIHSFDFDDHSRAKIHPGAVVIPTALALAEREKADGRRLLAAIAAGYETMVRVSLASNPAASRMRGWHLTGTTGTFAAAATAAVLLRLDEETTASALGLAGTQSSGLWAFNTDGAMSKRLHPGRAAQSGVMSVLLAKRGFHGPRFILEAEDGGFLKVSSEEPRPGEITRELGIVWRAENVCFKPYSCCGSNHSSIDAVLEVMREHRLKCADVDHVNVGVSRVVETQTGFVYRPSTVLNAQMSLRYNVAVAMLDGRAYLDQFTEERIQDNDVCELASRISVEVDPEMDEVYPELYAGKVTIVTRGGRTITKRVDYSKGMPENPMSQADIEEKFLSLAEATVGLRTAKAILDVARDAFELKDSAVIADRIGRSTILDS